ncbi:MAG: TRAP transporter small permease [Deltaproteobacteria bacterium]|nr:TRAP transporter small permease [Deltaproteobacteria bacterium]MBW2308712.1 TRAP transporter small permease [Deltaproteobacteria bacterium]
MKKILHQINQCIGILERWACVLILSVIVGSILTQVFFRYFLGNPLTWPEELSTFLLVWATFLGASWVIKQSRHAMVESFVNLLPERIKLGVLIAANLCVFGFLAVVLFSSFQLFPHLWDVRTVSLRIPRCFFLLAVMVSTASMILFFIEDSFIRVQRFWKPEEAGKKMRTQTDF